MEDEANELQTEHSVEQRGLGNSLSMPIFVHADTTQIVLAPLSVKMKILHNIKGPIGKKNAIT